MDVLGLREVPLPVYGGRRSSTGRKGGPRGWGERNVEEVVERRHGVPVLGSDVGLTEGRDVG